MGVASFGCQSFSLSLAISEEQLAQAGHKSQNNWNLWIYTVRVWTRAFRNGGIDNPIKYPSVCLLPAICAAMENILCRLYCLFSDSPVCRSDSSNSFKFALSPPSFSIRGAKSHITITSRTIKVFYRTINLVMRKIDVFYKLTTSN